MNAQELKFGIEIECFVPQEKSLRRGGYHRGLQIDKAPDGWQGQSDGSIMADAGHTPIEVVSPILAGEKGLTEVFYMAQFLIENEAKFNRSTGLHVHVEAAHLTQAQKIRLAKLFRQYEGAFLALTGESIGNRLNNSFCTLSVLWSELVDQYNRYRSLNFATGGKGTVEFRLFQGTADPAILVTAVYMCVALVAHVSQMTDEEIAALTPYPRSHALLDTAADFCRNIWSQVSNLILADEDIQDVSECLMANALVADGTTSATVYRNALATRWNR